MVDAPKFNCVKLHICNSTERLTLDIINMQTEWLVITRQCTQPVHNRNIRAKCSKMFNEMDYVLITLARDHYSDDECEM